MPAALPTNTPAPTIVLPTSDSTALATVAGIYSYKIVGLSFTMFLRPDGTYASLPSTGRFSVTADQITFVDMLPESGSLCSSEPGIYKWALKDSGLTLVPVTDNCASRANIFGTNTFEKMQDQANEPIEFVWRIQAHRILSSAQQISRSMYNPIFMLWMEAIIRFRNSIRMASS